MKSSDIIALNNRFANVSPQETIAFFIGRYKNKIALSSSLGAEDQVLTAMVCSIKKETTIFTLDTGRLFPETYDLIDRTNKRYDIKLKIFFPNYSNVENMVTKKGINLFYGSVENRKECCNVRKIKPLKRAFSTLEAWICGLRQEQSITRKSTQMIEWDKNNDILKINPLIYWTEKDVWDYIEQHNVPYNHLHTKNYPSIGCQPCTRAVENGKDVRAGRWWWENPNQKECGLHAE